MSGLYDLQSLLLHDLGHALGLDHSSIPGSVMGWRLAVATMAYHRQDGILESGEQVAPGVDAWSAAFAPGSVCAIDQRGVWVVTSGPVLRRPS